MKKKVSLLLLGAIMPLGMLMSACEPTTPAEENKHVCTFDTKWSFDDYSHWKACTGEDCKLKSELGAHDFVEGKNSDGTTYEECSVCGKVNGNKIAAEDGNTGSETGDDSGNTGTGGNDDGGNTGTGGNDDGGNTGTGGNDDGGNTGTGGNDDGGNTGTGGNDDGGNTGTQTTNAAYDLVQSLDKLDKAYILSRNDLDEYAAMTAKAKSETLPWYMVPTPAEVSSTMLGADFGSDAELFTFEKQTDGSYTIKTSTGNFLYSYIQGNHHSIGINANGINAEADTNCKYWTITQNGTAYTVKGKTIDVYLSYSTLGSFCGYTQAANIYFYTKGTGTGTGEHVDDHHNDDDNNDDDKPIDITQDSRWNVNFSEYGITFRDSLATLIKSKVKNTTTYYNCSPIGQQAAKNGEGRFTPFYHGSDFTYEMTTDGKRVNREHTWPDSRGGNLAETDPFMVRPTISADNSSRGNNFYGIGSSKEWDPASCGFEAARGESARIIFYVATKYGKSCGLSLSNNPNDPTSEKTMGTLKTLVEWNKKYPATDMEKQINNYLDSKGYGRNPFVDHPEYVDFIWNKSGYVTSAPQIDTNGTGTGTGTGTTTGGETGGGTGTGTQTKTPEFTLVESLNNLDKAYIVSSINATQYAAMGSKEKASSTPYYISYTSAELSLDKKGADFGSDAGLYTFTKQTDGSYTIKTSEGNFLYSYVKNSNGKTFYNIEIGNENSANSNCKYWTITQNGTAFTVKGTTSNVYLTASDKGSFSGNKESADIYFYVKGSETGSGTGTGGGTDSGNTGGTTVENNYQYTLIDALADIDKASAYIVTTRDASSFKAMTSTNPISNKDGSTLEWYFNTADATVGSDFKGADIGSNAQKFTFAKQSDGTYTIKGGDKYLYAYIEGTHYSMGMSSSTTNIKGGTINWNITTNGKGFTFKAKNDVYLTLGDPSFQGNKTAQSNPIYLYK